MSDLAIANKNKETEKSNGESTENHNGNKDDIQSHPAFGFKAALIRVIGNLVYRNEQNQNLVCIDLFIKTIHKKKYISYFKNFLQVRENDAISLLLDCSKIDARNPCILLYQNI